ncbi:hypothetical protein CARUB_v10023535mg [Capsella rubella]|uniref:Glabrous enhancer-binding protein-like DBD domain-containing protein n=1 Tax=Capsella rubella TaxID=81985 RepID=R0FWQ6_9BRAS|nr:GLABROUS1 enhancer-binding protein-like 3 [Capsella rubella]EOA27402.1 hypothetical protein CARUB_v10023535mg [Capsella rubella]
MVATKRLGDHSDSNSDDSLTRKRDDDVDAMRRKRKQLKTTTATLVPPSASKIKWTKNDELVILGGIVDFENETKLSFRSDRDALYHYIKDYVESNFSKRQLIDKVRSLKRKFIDNQARSNDGKELSFTDTDDDAIFKLSMMIWAKNETEHVGEDLNQAKDVPSGGQERKNVTCTEQEQVSVEVENGEKEKLDQAKDVPCEEQEDMDVPCEEQEGKDMPCEEQERVSVENDNGEQEMSEEDGVGELGVMEDTLDSGITLLDSAKNGEKDKSEEEGVYELGVLQGILEGDTFYQNCGKFQQKMLRQNLEKIGAEKRKQLIDEWNALMVEELKLYVKKLTFLAELLEMGEVSP